MSSSVSTQRLRELYRQSGQTEDLFPIFARTRSFEPWIVVLALIPALYVFQHAALSESDAEWVLRSRDLLQSHSVEGVIGPGGVDSAGVLRFQPPMGTWLTAAMRTILPEFGGYEGMLLAWIGTGLLILAIYHITKGLFGGRIALWAVLLCSGQGLILWQAQTVLPISLAILAALGAICFLQDHLLRERGVVTWQILGAGMCLGMCLLLGGPIVVLPVVVQLLTAVGEIRADRKKTVSIVSSTKRVLSLFLMWGICLIASGWWPALMASAYKDEFWLSWWHGILTETVSPSPLESLIQYLNVTGPILGLSFYGGRFLFRELVEDQNRAARQMMIWLVSGGIVSIASVLILGTDSLLAVSALIFLTLTLTLCAAVSFDRLSRGQLRVMTAVFLTLIPLLLVTIIDALAGVTVSADVWKVRGLSLFCLITLACLRAIRHRTSLGGRQLLPGACLILIVLINYRVGLSSSEDVNVFTGSTQSLESDQLGQLHKVLERIPEDMKRIELIAPENPTARFRLELVLAFPDAQISLARNWDQIYSRLVDSPSREMAAVIEWGVPQVRPRFPLDGTWRHRYLGQPEKIGDSEELQVSVLFPIDD